MIAAVTNPSLTPDFRKFPKRLQDYANQSTTQYSNWFNEKYWSLYSLWGPSYMLFNSSLHLKWPKIQTQYKMLRVAAAAEMLRGRVPYAHHHMAYWEVPASWNGNPVSKSAGSGNFTSGLGIDCSDLSHWSYSYGLGVHISSSVVDQSNQYQAQFATLNPKHSTILNASVLLQATSVPPQFAFDWFIEQLQPGDLLYIRGDSEAAGTNVGYCKIGNTVSHVVMFLGDLAKDVNNRDKNLVIDSHGGAVYDSNFVIVPTGPNIRPLMNETRNHSSAQIYYWGCFDHVLRWI